LVVITFSLWMRLRELSAQRAKLSQCAFEALKYGYAAR